MGRPEQEKRGMKIVIGIPNTGNGKTKRNRKGKEGRKGGHKKSAKVYQDGKLIATIEKTTFSKLTTALRRKFHIHPDVKIEKKIGTTEF